MDGLGYRSISEFIVEAVRYHLLRAEKRLSKLTQAPQRNRSRRLNIPNNLPKTPCPECGNSDENKILRTGCEIYSGGRIAVFYKCKICGRRYRGQIIRPSEVEAP
jgi:RNase P subunit RPR2